MHSQPKIALAWVQDIFEIINHVAGFAKFANTILIKVSKSCVTHRYYDPIIAVLIWSID